MAGCLEHFDHEDDGDGSSSICQWRLRAVDGCPTKTWLHFVQINMKSFGISYENANDKYDCRIKAKSG